MGNNSYFRTDSIGAKGYDFSCIYRPAYVHETNTSNYSFNFGGYYSPSTGGYSQASYAMPNSTYSSNPVSQGYADPNGGTQDSGNLIGAIQTHLANVASLSQIKDDKNLSQARKDEIAGILKEAKQIEKNARENANYSIILEGIVEMAAELDTQAAELFAVCQEEIANALQNPETKGSGGGSGEGAGSSTPSTSSDAVEVTEGDIELSDAEIKSRYGVSTQNPIRVDYMASSLASGACDEVNDWDDDDSRNAFKKYFGDGAVAGQVTSNNIIQVLYEIAKIDMEEFVQDIQDQDSGEGEASIRQLTMLISAHMDILVNAGFLDKKSDDYKNVNKYIGWIGSDLSDFDDKQENIANALCYIKDVLYKYGTEDYVSNVVKVKQAKETEEAANNYAKDYFESMNKEFVTKKNGATLSYNLPSDVKYLPNKKVYQITLEGKTFEGKDFKELNRKIMKCKDESIISNWISIKKPTEKYTYSPMDH